MAWLTPRRPDAAATARGLLPVVVQDAGTGEVLMLAWANDAALAATEETGFAHFWSRGRDALWRKGATSGNLMRVEGLAADCDGDAVLYRVSPAGPACHTGARSCFGSEAGTDGGEPGVDESGVDPDGDLDRRRGFTLRDLARVVEGRRGGDPAGSYTARLLAGGPRRAAEKVIEEAGELATAALAGSDGEVREEAADLLYHALVLLTARGISLEAVESALGERRAG